MRRSPGLFAIAAAASMAIAGIAAGPPVSAAPPASLKDAINPSGGYKPGRPSYGRGHSGSKKSINVTERRYLNKLSSIARKRNQRKAKGHAI